MNAALCEMEVSSSEIKNAKKKVILTSFWSSSVILLIVVKSHDYPTKKAFDCSVLIYIALMAIVFALGVIY